MNLVAYALCSLNDFKSYMGFKNSDNDEWAKLAINMATDFIESYCGRRFKTTVYTEEEYDGTGRRELQLKQFPVTTFTKLEINRATDNEDAWETIDDSEYWVDLNTGIITRTSNFNELDEDINLEGLTIKNNYFFGDGKNKYRATYTAGYAVGATDIPYDLQFACMSFANELWNDRQSGGMVSERLGDHQVQFSKAFEKIPMLQQVLDKYKDINI